MRKIKEVLRLKWGAHNAQIGGYSSLRVLFYLRNSVANVRKPSSLVL